MMRYAFAALGAGALLFIAGCNSQGSSAAAGAMHKAAAAGAAAPVEIAEKPGTPTDRRIRYTGSVEVLVKDMDAAADQVEALVAEKNGYVSKSERLGAVGERRSGTWTVKVPAQTFREVIAAFAGLGTLVRNTSDSEDLTEEYLDLEARVRNMKNEEDVHNKLLKESVTRLDDVLKMREQIAKIRGDIERAEGRLKYLTGVTSFSTINLTVRESKDYTPPVTPSFSSDVSEEFHSSYDALLGVGKSLVVLLAGLTPWLPLIIPAAILLWRLIRKWPTWWKDGVPVALQIDEPERNVMP